MQQKEPADPLVLPHPPAVPPVPRAVTRRAARRSWNEMSVRVWLILTVAVAIVCGYFAITRISEALTDRWLIQNGTPVVAKLGLTGGNMVPKRQPRNESLPSQLIFDLNGKHYQFDIRLEPRPNAYAQQGMDFPIRVDPNDPSRWTEETKTKPWSQELTVIFFLIPVLVVAALMTWWRRMQVLRIWRNEPLAGATVVDVRHTAIAPRSRVVRFALNDGDDRRVWSTLVPASGGIPGSGDEIWLICPPQNPGRALLASLYQ